MNTTAAWAKRVEVYTGTTPPPKKKHIFKICLTVVDFSIFLHVFWRKTAYAQCAICYRPFVRLSVTRVIHIKTDNRIMKFSPYGSPIHLGFVEFHIEILIPPPSGGAKQGWGGKNQPFSSFTCQYLENGSRYGQIVTIND